jgi:hypothetical protein
MAVFLLNTAHFSVKTGLKNGYASQFNLSTPLKEPAISEPNLYFISQHLSRKIHLRTSSFRYVWN